MNLNYVKEIICLSINELQKNSINYFNSHLSLGFHKKRYKKKIFLLIFLKINFIKM